MSKNQANSLGDVFCGVKLTFLLQMLHFWKILDTIHFDQLYGPANESTEERTLNPPRNRTNQSTEEPSNEPIRTQTRNPTNKRIAGSTPKPTNAVNDGLWGSRFFETIPTCLASSLTSHANVDPYKVSLPVIEQESQLWD